jgi:uncharacterized damage-inducible protein DinB
MKGLTLGAGGVLTAGSKSLIAKPSPKLAERFLATFNRAAAFNLEYANAMPAEHYDFKPVPEVRTFGGMLLHIAGSDVFFINYVSGGDGGGINFEPEEMTKDVVVDLMNQSDDYVRAALKGVTDEQMAETVETFAGELTKEEVCWFMRDHITHTRGQLIIYLRMNGITPPQYVGT